MPQTASTPEKRTLHDLPFRRPWLLLLLSALLAVLGGYVFLFELEIQSGRRQLSNLDSPLNQRSEAYRRDFGVGDSIVLVVTAAEGVAIDPMVRRRMKQVAQDWANSIRSRPELFPDVIDRVAAGDLGPLAFLYLPSEVFAAAVIAIDTGTPMLQEWAQSPSLANLLVSITERLPQLGASRSEMPEALLTALVAQLEQFLAWFDDELSHDHRQADLSSALSASLVFGDFDADGYLFVDDGRMLLVPTTLLGDSRQPNEYALPVEFAWDAVESALAGLGEGAVITAGLAGLPALDYEEMVTSQGDFARGAVISLVLVTFLFMWAFRSLKRPVLAALCLCMSIGMTFAFTWLVVGHLNLVAMVFAIILVVLGIDFAIHYTTHYERALAVYHDPAIAGRNTLGRIGGALWMGGLTTVAAFLSAGFTEAPGLAELGIIAGGGLAICLVMMVLVYPAMLYLADRGRVASVPVAEQAAKVGVVLTTGAGPSLPMRMACLLAIGLAIVGYACGQYHFDTNLLSLQPTDGKAAHWQRLLLAADDRSQFAIATYADRESLDSVRRRFDAMPELVRSTISVFPSDEQSKREALAALRDGLVAVVFADPAEPSPRGLRRAFFGLRTSVRKMAAASAEAATALAGVVEILDQAYGHLRVLPEKQAENRLARMQSDVLASAQAAHGGLLSLCSPSPMRLDLAPRLLRKHFVGRSGTLALQIHPQENTWEPDALDRFVTAAIEIEPKLFGGVVNFKDNARTMVESFAQASCYSLAAVLILVLLWSRSLRDTLLALFPLIISIGLLLGIMRFSPFGALSWNFANFFALPILIGVGVDSGIHLLRAFGDSLSAFRAARRAVLVSALTTLIGFGILSSSQHLGVRSLGMILSIGISLVLVTSLLLMPVVLQMFGRSQRGDDGGAAGVGE